jgi:propanediol dehydratase large subunit
MAVLPVVQRLGVGQYTGVFGIHVNRSPAQVDELRFGMQNQNIFALTVVNGYGKEIAFSVGAEKRRRLYGVQLIEFTRLQIDCDLPFL